MTYQNNNFIVINVEYELEEKKISFIAIVICVWTLVQRIHIFVWKIHSKLPMCFDELFDSTKSIMKMKCGHTIHVECYNDLLKEGTFSSLRCPLCSKSSSDWTTFSEI